MRLRLTTYLKYRNIPRLRKKEYDWFCTKLQNNTIRLQLGSAKYAPKFMPSIDIDPPTIFWRFATHDAWDTFCYKDMSCYGGRLSTIYIYGLGLLPLA